MSPRYKLGWILLILPLFGCYGTIPKKLYSGKTLPLTEIAVVSENRPFNIHTVNGIIVDDFTQDIHVLSGNHSLGLNYYTEYQEGNYLIKKWSTSDCCVTFEAKRGEHYTVQGKVEDKSWNAFITDSKGIPVTQTCDHFREILGDAFFYGPTLMSRTIIDYEMVPSMQLIKKISLVEYLGEWRIFIHYENDYGEIIGNVLHWREKGKTKFSSEKKSSMVIIEIPDNLNFPAEMFFVDRKDCIVSSDRVRIKDDAQYETLALEIKRTFSADLSTEALKNQGRYRSQYFKNTYH